MEGLEARLVEFYSPQTDTLRMRQLEQELHEFRKRPDALQLALQFLERSSSPYVQWFCAMILEEWVGRRWVALGPAQQDQLRQFVLHYLTDTSRRLEPFVVSKMSKVLVDIGKMAWPQQYPRMFEDVRSLCMSPTTYPLGLSLLSMIGIEFVREDLVLPSKRKAELRSGLQAELPAIIQLLTSLLAHGGSSDLTVAALRCLGGYVESGAMTPVLSQSVCAEVFKVLQGTDAQGRLLLLDSQVAAEAVRVLTEVLNKRLVPPELGDFVLSVAMSMCSILQGLVRPSEGPALVSTIDESLLAGLVEFMTVFLEQHLGRMLANPAFPFANFLVLLAEFTFGLPGPRVLQRCFLPWTALLEHLSESEAGLQALGDSSEMLSLFARALLDKMLFVTNADALSELDDEAPLAGGGGQGEESAAADQLPDWDDEDEAGALPVERSEQQEVIGEGAALLRSLARLPSCSMALSTRVLSLLHEALAALEAASGADVEQRRVDACTLLSLAVVLVPQSPADAYWSILHLVLDFTRRVTAARLYSRGAGWVDLQCSMLEALRDLSQGLDAAVAGGSSVTEKAVSGIVDVALASLDTMVVPAPEPVQREAAALVLSLAQRLPFDLLRSCRAFQGLLANDSYQRLLAPLPLSVQERLIQAISLLLLPNTTARPVAGLDDAAMAHAYAAFLTPLLRSLAEGQEQLAAGGRMNQQQQQPIPPSIRRTAGALRALCSLYKTTPKRIKQVLYNALLPGLPSVLPCVSLTLAKLGHVTGSSGAARTLMNLLMALVVCFGKDLGPTFISDVMGVFTALFSSPDFVGGLSRQVSASKQQRHRRNPSDSSVSYSASTFVVASLLRLLARILSERWSSASSFLPAICSLLLDQLLLLVRAAPTELTALFLDVTAALLTEHWRFFVAAGAVNRMGLPEGPKRFTSAEAQDIFNRFMEVILEVLRSVCLPPATVRKAIDVLLLLSKSVSLFTLQHFRDTVGPAFTLALIDVLLSRAHPLLRDDIAMLLYEMTVGADPDAAIAQPILVHITGLSDAQRGELMQSFPQDRDGPNFVRGLKSFLNDVEFLRLCNEAAAAS